MSAPRHPAAPSTRTRRATMRRRLLLLPLLAAAAALLGARPALALRAEATFGCRSGLTYFTQQPFGFRAGGTYSVAAEYLDAQPAYALPFLVQLCSSSEIASIPANGYRCSVNATQLYAERTCAIAVTFDATYPGEVTLDGSVSTDGAYSLLFWSCDPTTRLLRARYNFVNPNGNNLSSDQEPLPTIFQVFVVLWGLQTLLWVANRLRHARTHIPLHSLLSVLPLLRVILAALLFNYWNTLMRTGTVPAALWTATLVLLGLYELQFFAAAALISKGWSITRSRMLAGETRLILTIGAVLAATVILFTLYTTYVMVALIILFILLLRYVFVHASINVHYLQVQAAFVEHSRTMPQSNVAVINSKIALIQAFQRIFGSFIFFTLLFVVGLRFFLPQLTWLQVVSIEIVDYVTNLCLFWVFRLRNFADIIERDMHASSATPPPPPEPVVPDEVMQLNLTLVSFSKPTQRVPVLVLRLPHGAGRLAAVHSGLVLARWTSCDVDGTSA